MSEPRPQPNRYYVPGDEIRILVELRHQFNIDEVRVVFVSGDGSRITLIGEPDSTEVIEEHGGHVVDWKRSFATLVTLVDVDHLAGDYWPSEFVLRTASGQRYRDVLDPNEAEVSSAAFRIVDEVEPPTIRLAIDDDEEG